MSKKIPYKLQVESIKSLNHAVDFLTSVQLHCNLLPEYMPIKWGWYEPLKQDFDPNQLESLLYKSGKTDNVWWKRTGKNKAEGSFMNRWGQDPKVCTDSTIALSVYETSYQDKLLHYLKIASKTSEADIAYLDSIAEQYKEISDENHFASYGDLFITTHTLRHWLPDMPWTVVFGPAYVRLFGKERLLTCPAHKVEEIGDEMVFIQLTENIPDIHEKYEEVMQARTLAKKHLGEECFFKPERAYDYKNSMWNKLTAEEIEAKRGKVFRVPEFNLRPD